MSTCRISPTSPGKTIMRSNTTTSTTTVQLQLRRSISVENENGAATLAFLAALVKNSNCSSAKQDGVGGLDAIKKSSSLNSNSLSTEKDCANVPIINQQHVEPIVLSTTSQSSIATLPTTTVNSSSNTNSNSAKSSSISQNLHHQIPSDILDDLASRFIINTPVDERQNLIRICFQIELAHWFYLDFFCGNEEKKLIPCGLKQFALHLFQHIPFLRNYLSEIDKILEDWKEYKLSVPTYGAILVSEDLKNVLLVQSYWAKSSWGFPKGKINEHEDPVHCATREVYEETGFDITNMIIPDHYIECVINYQYTRLYIIRNVSISTTFSPRTRKEIKCCEWFPLDSLPTTKNDPNCKSQLGINANSFFMIIPFMKRLKKWINDNRSGIERKYSSSSPITTFNNNNGCGNYYGNNASGNYNYNNNSNINGLVKQHSSAKKIILDIKKSGNCTSNNINNSNSNQLKGTINNNSSNNNNNQKSKRQRHKSMGDIDGINLKLNFIKNNSSNNGNNNINRSQQQQQQQQQQQSNGYDNNKIHNNSTPKNNCNNKDNNDMKKCFFEDNLKYSSGKHINSKRQLFSCISTDGSTNSDKIITNNNINNNNITNNNNILNNNINSNKKDKEKNSQIFNNINSNNNNNNNKNGGNNNINNNNSIRSRTKSLGQNNNNLQQSIISNGVQRKNSNENKDGGNMRKKSHNLQQQHQTQQQQHEQKQRGQIVQQQQQQGHKEFIINNNNINVIEIENKLINNHHNFLINSCTNQQRQFMKLKQQHEELKAEQQKNQINSQHIVTDNIKFNPNFDSWTNFSFTKNFIANVFC